jgi:large subunit ribosomal protein L17
MFANMVCSLITEKRIKTTLPKARAARVLADKMVTLGKRNTLSTHRLAVARLHQKDAVKELFDNVAPGFASRTGGYTRILKLGKRSSDGSEMAYLEFVEAAPVADAVVETAAVAETVEA